MLKGVGHGIIGHPSGFAGRSLLGMQTMPYLVAAPGSAASLAQKLSPNATVGDVFIAGVSVSPANTPLLVRPDGTYYSNVGGTLAPQTVAVDGYSRVFSGLYGQGSLIINDRPPVPTNGQNFVGNTTFALGVFISQQLLATDPDGDVITWTLIGALPPGLSLSSTGVLSGTPTTLGAYGFTIRVSDPFGAFTDVPDSAVISSVLSNYVGQQLSVATAALNALGISVSSSQTASARPLNEIVTQVPPAQTPISNTLTTVVFQVSDGSGFVGLPNLFPSNIAGLTWNGSRSTEFNSTFQEAITGKTSTSTFTKYPTIEWDLNYELLNQAAALDDLRKIIGLFNQQQAGATYFLYIDPAFNTVSQEVFFVGDGSTKKAQLKAQYGVAGGPGLPEIIQSLQSPTTVVVRDITAGVTLVQGTDYTIGATGMISFTSAPATNHQIAWTGSFYYLCKFIPDNIDPEQFMQQFWSLQSIRFRSVIIV